VPGRGAGRRPALTLADRLLATLLRHRFGCPSSPSPPCSASAPRPINRRIRHTRQLLDQAGHTIASADRPLTGLDDLYDLATTGGLAIPTRITTAS